MNRTLKVVFACAFGAGIGAMIALQIGGYLWWIGTIVGAMVGYISFEFKAVISAPGLAWRKTIAYKIDRQKISKYLKKAFWIALLLGDVAAYGFAVAFAVPLLKTCAHFPLVATYPHATCLILPIPSIIWSVILGSHLAQGNEELGLKYTFIFFNPLYIIIFSLPAFLWFTALCMYGIIFPFCKTLFLQIHSDERLLCFFDAGIGAGIGYFAGHALIGAIAGGILGVLNYEVVSKILLKLVPVKS
ncbi:MAG: hypothetical protein WC460_01965 [Patescibacteria group bacterium]